VLPDEDAIELGSAFDLPDIDLPDIDLPDIDLGDIDLPDIDLGDIDLDDIDLDDIDLGSSAGNEPNSDLPHTSRPTLSNEEQAGCKLYSSGAYMQINTPLWGGKEPTGQYGVAHQQLQAAFAKAEPFDEPVVVHRGLTFDEATLKKWIKDFQQAKDTSTSTVMDGYISTSTKQDNAFAGNLVMKIKAKKGLDLKPYSHYPHENELLLNHQSAFKVLSIQKKGNQWHVEMEQL
jgi:hypothetical protein